MFGKKKKKRLGAVHTAHRVIKGIVEETFINGQWVKLRDTYEDERGVLRWKSTHRRVIEN